MAYENRGLEFYPHYEAASTDTDRGTGLGVAYTSTSSGSFTFLTSGSTTTTWNISGKDLYNIHQMSIVNNSSATTYVSVSLGTVLATSNYIIYNQFIDSYGVLNPITKENQYFLNAGRSIFVQQTASVNLSYCASFIYFGNEA